MALSGKNKMAGEVWISRNTEIKNYEVYPSGIQLQTALGIVKLDIQFLARIVDEWQKANPQIPFSLYRNVPEPPMQRSGEEETR